MAERETSNREKILEAAIVLFSERGFSAVSQREIAAAVGIKAASIYNHFQSKEAILEAIVERLSCGLEDHVRPAFEPEELISLRDYIEGIIIASDRYFATDATYNLGLIIMREQFTNPVVRKMIYEMMLRRPRESLCAYFARLMDAGMMRKGDPLFAAKEYHAFFVYGFYEDALSFGIRDGSAERTQTDQAHKERFIKNWEL